MDRDALEDRINSLESSLDEWRIEFKEVQEKSLTLAPVVEEKKTVYEAARLEFETKNKELKEAQFKAQAIAHKGREGKSELEKLKRELGRILDAERVRSAQAEKFKAFSEKFPTAMWRVGNANGDKAFPHQIEGATHMAIAERIICGDERGTGKTLTSLIYSDFIEAKKIIIIVPSDVQGNFVREVGMWSDRPVIQLGGNARNERDFILNVLQGMNEYVCVMNYEAWRKDRELISRLKELQADTLILDEAHHAKDPESLTANGLFQLALTPNKCPSCSNPKLFKKVKRDVFECRVCEWSSHPVEANTIKNVVPMTGTPILNMPVELFTLCRLVDPYNFTTPNAFLNDFCEKIGSKWHWRPGGEDRLIQKIGPRFIKRTRKDSGVTLPPMEVIKHIIPWSEFEQNYPTQHGYYLQARDYAELMLDPVNEISMNITIFLTVLLRLRQVITAPTGIVLKDKDDNGNERILAKIDTDEAVKLDKAEALIKEIIDEGDRVVVFSQLAEPLRKMKERLNKLGISAGIYAGQSSKVEKEQIELDFDAKTAPPVGKEKFKVALVNSKSGGEGLNFTAASHAIILDREWNPGRESQVSGRLDRMGQAKNTFIHIIEVEDTVDVWMSDIIQQKANIIAGFDEGIDVFRSAYEALKAGKM